MGPELMAPERFGFKNSRPTKASDCYALGMVIYETISGNLPFHKHADLAVVTKVLEGKHPPRSKRFMDGLWKLLEKCWACQPNNRPAIEDVRRCLETFSNLSEPLLGVDVRVEDGGDNWDLENSSFGVPNGTIGTTTTGRSTTMFLDVSYLTDHPLGEGINNLGREVTHPVAPIPRFDSNDGDTYQVTVVQSHASSASHTTHCIEPAHSSRSDRSGRKT